MTSIFLADWRKEPVARIFLLKVNDGNLGSKNEPIISKKKKSKKKSGFWVLLGTYHAWSSSDCFFLMLFQKPVARIGVKRLLFFLRCHLQKKKNTKKSILSYFSAIARISEVFEALSQCTLYSKSRLSRRETWNKPPKPNSAVGPAKRMGNKKLFWNLGGGIWREKIILPSLRWTPRIIIPG